MSQFTLSTTEAKVLEKQAQGEKRRTGWRERLRETRQENAGRPGFRGWPGPGGGSAAYVEPSYEVLGTTVQVCGYWPFAAGSASPTIGVPLGHSLLNGSVVCGDPIYYFLANLVTNPSMFVLGRPGLGKSSLVRHILTIYEAWGVLPMVLGDLKPDYVDLIQAQGGQVIAVGPDRNAVNPLDRGPMYPMLDRLPDDLRRRVEADLRAFQITTVTGLLQHAGGRALGALESTIVSIGLRELDERITGRAPVLPDLLTLIEAQDEVISRAVQDRGDGVLFRSRVQHLVDVLRKLGPEGPYGDLFCRETTVQIDLERPVAFDLSSIDDADLSLQAAVQQICWAYGSSAVSAAKRLSDAGVLPERHYVLVMDELWRMLRADPKLVHFIDALTRLNRTMGVGQIMITHTMNDLKLPHEEQTQMAWGFVERAGMVMLGGLAEGEMGNLSTVFSLSSRERDLVTDWSSEMTVNPETGESAAPPGQGCFLLKIGKRPGTPFRVRLTEVEKYVNDTNRAWHGIAAETRSLRTGRVVEVSA